MKVWPLSSTEATLESLGNDNGDGNENGKKTIDLD